MSIHVNGIIQTETGYAVKNFMPEGKQVPVSENISFSDYETAVHCLSGRLYPDSYRQYLLAVKDREPDNDMWNNLIFIGHTDGFYDHENQRFKTARQMDMGAATETEIAYIEALQNTYKSIQSMVRENA